MRSAASDAEYRSLLLAQDGRCAICGATTPGGPANHTRFYADHDHSTGELRGLLCLKCNLVLGLVADDFDRLQKTTEYLRAKH